MKLQAFGDLLLPNAMNVVVGVRPWPLSELRRDGTYPIFCHSTLGLGMFMMFSVIMISCGFR